MTRTIWLIVLLPILACKVHGDGAEVDPAETRVPVGIATVVRDTISETVQLTGRLAPLPGGVALMSAQAGAPVRGVAVQVGEPVKAGQLLVDLESPELAASARSLRATADAAEVEANRQSDLFAKGITSRKQADEAAAQATSARSAAEAAERLLEQARVTSPLAGGVQRVLVHVGERVAAGTPLVEVIRADVLDLLASASPNDLARLRVGQQALVTGEGGTEPRPAVVNAIAPAVDSSSNAGGVVVRIARPGLGLRPGAGATATVLLGRRNDALIVPDSALVLVGDSMSVFVIADDSVVQGHPVAVGVRAAGRAEVRGDLKPGDRVVTTGAYGLSDGMRVVPPAAP